EEIEHQIKGLATLEQRLPMLALYALFGYYFSSQRSTAYEAVLDKYESDLAQNAPEALIVHLLTEWDRYAWRPPDYEEAWHAYFSRKGRKGSIQFGHLFNAAILLRWAEACRLEGKCEWSISLVRQAVEELPGHTRLMEFEEEVRQQGPDNLPEI